MNNFEERDYLNKESDEIEEIELLDKLDKEQIENEFENLIKSNGSGKIDIMDLHNLKLKYDENMAFEKYLNDLGKFKVRSLKYPLLIICGISGSGKSTFEGKLVATSNNFFNKLPQVTTRKQRNPEDPYYFVDNDVYENLEEKLIAKLGNFGQNKYGTLPLYKSFMFNTVVASADAIRDIMIMIKDGKLSCTPYLVMLDMWTCDIPKENRRVGRDDKFIDNERFELQKVIVDYRFDFEKFVYYKIYNDGEGNLMYPEIKNIFK